MGKLSLWDLLLIGLLVTPIGVGSLFLYSMWGLLTVEVVPADQGDIPVPRPGERVDVYGTWVRDRGHALGDYGWNEIHPAVFLRNLDSGAQGGSQQCNLLENVHGTERLRILNLLSLANGLGEECSSSSISAMVTCTLTLGSILNTSLWQTPVLRWLGSHTPPLSYLL
ncbi:MAG TPA: hypothetical protein VI816_00960 [Candidatus Bathyarchaeia archaeon]|nr:hypothetical protein [Candidatus Bathyarchaeia archaeon]